MLSTTALFHFNQSGVSGVLANLVAIPLTEFVVMPLLMLSLLLDVVGLAAPVYWLLGKSMDLLLFIAVQVSSWPCPITKLPLIPPLGYGLLVIGGLWACL
jgi:competence protein ComEC